MESSVQPLPFELNIVERCGKLFTVKNGAHDGSSDDGISVSDPARAKLQDIINQLGVSSARVQHLKSPITCSESFLTASPDAEQRLYIVTLSRKKNQDRSCRQAVGFLKVGWKHLLLLDEAQRTHETTVLCVLDFFVQQKHRRLGYGKKLFDCMLMNENKKPWEIPVDNPSFSFRHFLRKHFNLTLTIPQLNRFVIFSGFPFPSGGVSSQENVRPKYGSPVDSSALAPAVCPLNFFQETYQREDLKSSSWRVLGLDGPSYESNELS